MNTQQQPQSQIGDRVRDARLARGWSQRRLAKEAGVSENTILNTESGRHAARPSKRRAILDALGIVEADRSIDLDGVPDDVLIFLRHVSTRLSRMDENARARLLAQLYPQIIAEGPAFGEADDTDEVAARMAREARATVRRAHDPKRSAENGGSGLRSS